MRQNDIDSKQPQLSTVYTMMSPPPSPVLQDSSPSGYRTARALPAQLLEHTTSALEEGLYADALALLSSTLTSGTGVQGVPALVPTPRHLALAATLAVHPSLTTRTTQPDRQIAADDALRYLQQVLKLVGPIGAEFHEAFRFKDRNPSYARGGRVRRQPDDGTKDVRGITSNFAGKDALWTSVDDFWSVVGWTFNCSATCQPRWERWRLWLAFMLDVLEADLDQRIKESRTGEDDEIQNSLLAQYLASTKEAASRTSRRRILRAIFADGSSTSQAMFPEVFPNETRPPKRKRSLERVSARKAIDLENGEFGDYAQSDSTSSDSSSRPRRRPPRTPQSAPTHPTSPKPSSSPSSPLTHPSALILRHRLLTLLSTLCITSPRSLCSHADLSALLTETLRPLPLADFTRFVLPPTTPYLTPPAAANLLQTLLRPLLSAHAPAYSDEAPLTPAVLARHYAPFAANGVKPADHAKVAVCVEAMVRVLWRGGGLLTGVKEGEVKDAVRKGVEARRKAIGAEDEKGRSGRGAGAGGASTAVVEARKVADGCADRIMAMLELAKMGTG
nr:hypothetical protein CFP56_50855 [Quercus suber]